jgi:DNA-binding HxlR family transcriptional regulator/putative sterol carrier protein
MKGAGPAEAMPADESAASEAALAALEPAEASEAALAALEPAEASEAALAALEPAEASEPPAAGERAALFCPVARALDLIGERWVLVLLRHLLGGPRGFSELRQRTGIAPRVLSTRLRQLSTRGFIEQVEASGRRFAYALTPRGARLAPILREIARWWVLHEMAHTGPFGSSSPASVVEALPFLLREERARGVHSVYELRLTGEGGGVWTIEIDDGQCRVREGFAGQADVRYTALARDWCALALGRLDDRQALASGRLAKEGPGGSLAWYFHQPALASDERAAGDER